MGWASKFRNSMGAVLRRSNREPMSPRGNRGNRRGSIELSTTHAAFAQSPGKGKMPELSHLESFEEEVVRALAQADVDGDGQLGPQELLAITSRLVRVQRSERQSQKMLQRALLIIVFFIVTFGCMSAGVTFAFKDTYVSGDASLTDRSGNIAGTRQATYCRHCGTRI